MMKKSLLALIAALAVCGGALYAEPANVGGPGGRMGFRPGARMTEQLKKILTENEFNEYNGFRNEILKLAGIQTRPNPEAKSSSSDARKDVNSKILETKTSAMRKVADAASARIWKELAAAYAEKKPVADKLAGLAELERQRELLDHPQKYLDDLRRQYEFRGMRRNRGDNNRESRSPERKRRR